MSSGQSRLLAAGGVVWRRTARGLEVLLVHRPQYDDWSFPKGKCDPGENLLQTAIREVGEETGVPVRLGASLGSIEYDVPRGRKAAHYWSMPVPAGSSTTPSAEDPNEIDDFAWMSPDSAARSLSYDDDIAILRHWEAIGQSEISLLIVRHGRAGSRSEWPGPDDERPLDRKGRAQAAQIAEILPSFGPGTICTAPPLRCRQTVAPLANRLAIPVQLDDALTDRTYEQHPKRSSAALRSYLQQPDVVVACSQGDTIEHVLTELVPAHARPRRPKKGGVWAIGTLGDRIATADYYPSLLPAL